MIEKRISIVVVSLVLCGCCESGFNMNIRSYHYEDENNPQKEFQNHIIQDIYQAKGCYFYPGYLKEENSLFTIGGPDPAGDIVEKNNQKMSF